MNKVSSASSFVFQLLSPPFYLSTRSEFHNHVVSGKFRYIWLNKTLTFSFVRPTPQSGVLACTKFYLHFVRFEVFAAVTMKNTVSWDIKTQFVPHRRHITSTLQSQASQYYIRFEVFTAVTEECRILGYKNQVRTSQETHYFPATESRRLMLCKILRFFTAVTMKNSVFWVMQTQYIPHGKHITSPLQNPAF
jgi:hypothetical protein